MNKILSLEIDQKSQKVELHLNEAGLTHLLDILNFIKANKKQDEHYHLMTPSWGGEELTEEKQNDASNLVNHFQVVFWDKK